MDKTPQKLLLIEFNEVNFDFVRRYIARGELPTLGRLLARHELTETSSESEYEHLEPWIQWVTAHTGKTLAEHGVFRLGDIVEQDIDQIWEKLERAGLRVGAISPMNAKNRTRNAAFFVPDPWTKTAVSGDRSLQLLSEALAQVVGDNASSRIAPSSYFKLLGGLLSHFRISTFGQLVKLALGKGNAPWYGAMFLDRFLADVFVRQWRRHQPDFASLFLNAAAHIQHHYMFSSAVYDGPNRNPDWYLAPGRDPLLDIYRVYDSVVADMLALPGAPRIMIATGLHQDPYPQELFYYRLVNHADFLRRLGVRFSDVLPLMSRDFTISFATELECSEAARLLNAVRAPDGMALFNVDNRGTTLFVMLTYPKEIRPGFVPAREGEPMWDIHPDVAFVALKNGEHNGIGYFIDTGAGASVPKAQFPLAELPGLVGSALGVDVAAGLHFVRT
jgi:hypothetical protein